MTARGWLARQQPVPPAALADAVARALDGESEPDVDALAAAARSCLDEARARDGRVRDSAFELLAADALLTYACAEAVEGADPERVWIDLLSVGEG